MIPMSQVVTLEIEYARLAPGHRALRNLFAYLGGVAPTIAKC
jgi:hypothetical protein